MTLNPLLAPWTGPHQLPPFADIDAESFGPALEEACQAHQHEVDAIIRAGEPATFENTVEAFERSGALLARVEGVFWNLVSAHTSPALQAVEETVAPKLAAHHHALLASAPLFARVAAVDLEGLEGEPRRVTELLMRKMRRAGAELGAGARERVGAIQERLATLYARFMQNVLADESAWTLPLTGDDLAGLPEGIIEAARAAGEARGLDHPVVTLSRSMVMPLLETSEVRGLRRQVYEAWVSRGENEERDNRPIIAEVISLRRELATLFGHESFAHYALSESMAKTPDAVRQLLEQVWQPARARAGQEREELAKLAKEDGVDVLEPWDWRFYAARHREAQGLRVNEARPYLSLEAVRKAAFACAERLFNVRFVPAPDFPVYHPDVLAFEVRQGDAFLGVFYGDYFARPSKRSGAWMSEYRVQQRVDGDVRPVVCNVLNFNRGEPTLLTMDDARTLFHELGHGLHGLLSDVRYPSISGTRVAQDFVELPSQLLEHWLEQPEVLEEFARHTETDEPMPDDIRGEVLRARNLDQGFQTVEYLGSAAVDLDLHAAMEGDLDELEAATLARLGMPREIGLRHRLPHFQHVFAGDDYASQYYSYLWAGVLDSDAFEAFREAGDIFDPGVAKRLHDHVYSAGARREPEDSYRAFRGAMPSVEPLLRRRGFSG